MGKEKQATEEKILSKFMRTFLYFFFIWFFFSVFVWEKGTIPFMNSLCLHALLLFLMILYIFALTQVVRTPLAQSKSLSLALIGSQSQVELVEGGRAGFMFANNLSWRLWGAFIVWSSLCGNEEQKGILHTSPDATTWYDTKLLKGPSTCTITA